MLGHEANPSEQRVSRRERSRRDRREGRRVVEQVLGHNYIGHNYIGHDYSSKCLKPVPTGPPTNIDKGSGRWKRLWATLVRCGSRADEEPQTSDRREPTQGHNYIGHNYVGHVYIGRCGSRVNEEPQTSVRRDPSKRELSQPQTKIATGPVGD